MRACVEVGVRVSIQHANSYADQHSTCARAHITIEKTRTHMHTHTYLRATACTPPTTIVARLYVARARLPEREKFAFNTHAVRTIVRVRESIDGEG